MRREGGSCGVSANEYSCTQEPKKTFGDLTPYLTYATELKHQRFLSNKTALFNIFLKLIVTPSQLMFTDSISNRDAKKTGTTNG
jgi:hypothetical protein